MAWIRMFTSLNLPLPVLLSRLMAALTPALDVAPCYQNLPHETQIPGDNPVIKSRGTNKPSDQGVKSDAVRVTPNTCSSLTHPKFHTCSEPI